jgi:hypothetical protein
MTAVSSGLTPTVPVRVTARARMRARLRKDGDVRYPGNVASSVGWRARRELRRLAKAGDRGDQNAIEAVWQAWLAHRDDARWDLLAQWRDPGELARAVFAAAVDPDRAPGEREAIGQFCARRGLMPDDDIQQVLFYVLTGQLARYREADARGRLLGAVYQRVGHRTRTALQQALAEAGDVHTLPGSTVNDRVRHGLVRIGAPVIRSSPDKIVLAFADRSPGQYLSVFLHVLLTPVAAGPAANGKIIHTDPITPGYYVSRGELPGFGAVNGVGVP